MLDLVLCPFLFLFIAPYSYRLAFRSQSSYKNTWLGDTGQRLGLG